MTKLDEIRRRLESAKGMDIVSGWAGVQLHKRYIEDVEYLLGELGKHRWIPCSERLPEGEISVLVALTLPHRNDVDLMWLGENGLLWCADTFEHDLECVTHWMPLPEPPVRMNEAKSNSSDSKHPKIIAVDFDGCLVTNRFPDIGEPIHETIAALKREQEDGAKIILWTCRVGDRELDAVRWCAQQGISLDAVNDNLQEMKDYFGNDTRKVFANEYWDDRARMMPLPEPPEVK